MPIILVIDHVCSGCRMDLSKARCSASLCAAAAPQPPATSRAVLHLFCHTTMRVSAPLLPPQGSFQGTLFRFPLRSSSTAASSDIKASATSAGQALGLLQSLAAVLPQALLFLKSLRQIEVYVVGDAELDAAAAAAASGDKGGLGDNSEAGAEASAVVAAAAAAGAGAGDKPRLLFRATLSALDGESQHCSCC
jgi:hypothetical protein